MGWAFEITILRESPLKRDDAVKQRLEEVSGLYKEAADLLQGDSYKGWIESVSDEDGIRFARLRKEVGEIEALRQTLRK